MTGSLLLDEALVHKTSQCHVKNKTTEHINKLSCFELSYLASIGPNGIRPWRGEGWGGVGKLLLGNVAIWEI